MKTEKIVLIDYTVICLKVTYTFLVGAQKFVIKNRSLYVVAD